MIHQILPLQLLVTVLRIVKTHRLTRCGLSQIKTGANEREFQACKKEPVASTNMIRLHSTQAHFLYSQSQKLDRSRSSDGDKPLFFPSQHLGQMRPAVGRIRSIVGSQAREGVFQPCRTDHPQAVLTLVWTTLFSRINLSNCLKHNTRCQNTNQGLVGAPVIIILSNSLISKH